MEATIDILRGEIERLFSVEEIHALSKELLDIDPAELAGVSAKGALARQLVDKCRQRDALEALADAVTASRSDADSRVREIYRVRVPGDLPLGSAVGDYKLLKKLGEGGAGVVYLAESPAGKFAVKVIRLDHARDRRAVQRYLTAGRLQRKVEHAGLVPVRAVGEGPGGRPFIAMDYIDGTTLAQRVSRTGPMHYSEVRPLVRSLLEGLHALHQKGLVHGDIKPENVMLHRSGEATVAVLCDFGTDRLSPRRGGESGSTGPLAIFGTPKALAPEQLRGDTVDARTDVYGCGALLYEILTGKAPFAGPTPVDVLVNQLTRDPEPPSRIAPKGWVGREIDLVVLKALRKEARERHKSAIELLEELESCARAIAGAKDEAKAPSVPREDAEAAAQLLLENPTDGTMAVTLEKNAAGAGDWTIATEAFEKAVDMVEAKELKKDLLFRAARIWDGEIHDVERAEAAYRKVLEIDPDDDMAPIALEELKRGSGRHEEVIEMLLERLEASADASERASLLREVARVYQEEIGQPEKAFDAISMAFLEAPRDAEVVRELEKIVGAGKKWAQLVQMVSAAAQEPREGTDAVAIYTRLGRWYAVELGRPDFALPCYSQALTIDPASDGAYEGICEIYRRSQSWAELSQALLRRADATPNPARGRGFLIEAASIIEDRLSDRKRAADLYRRIVADDPSHPDATVALEQVYRKESDWQNLGKLLEGKAKVLAGHEKAEVLAQVAELYEDRLANAEEATRRYEGVLEIEAKNLSALKGLERLYAKAGKFRELLTNLRAQLDVSATPRQKVSLLDRIGAIHEEQFVEHEAAANAYGEALDIDGHFEPALTALARNYRALGLWEEVVGVLERHVKIVEEAPRKVELYGAMGRVLMDSLHKPDRALAAFRSVLQITADDRAALTAVARLCEETNDPKGSVAALEKVVTLTKEPKERAEAYSRMGRLLSAMGDRESAIPQFKRALDEDPTNAEASAGLRSSFADRGDYGGAIAAIEKEIASTAGALAKSKLLAEMGNLYRDKVEDPKNAETSFRRALELDPTNVDAASPMAEILFESERWSEAVRLYETWSASAASLSREQAIRLFARLGIIYTKLGRNDDALAAFKKAREAAPDDRNVLGDMARAAFETSLYGEARALYAEFLSRYGKDLPKDERAIVLYRLGESKRQAGEMEASLGSLAEAIELDPRNVKALEAKAAVHVALSQWEDAIRSKRLLMDLASETERHSLLVEVGDMLSEKLGDRQKAAKSYSAALEIKPNDRNVLTRLMQVYSDEKDWTKLVEVVLKIAELIDDPRQLAKYHNTAAAICHREAGKPDQALGYYDMALDNDPTMLKAFEAIVEILAEKQDWGGLERAYRKMIFRLPKEGEAETKIRLWNSLGEIYHHRLQNVGEAISSYETAQELDPSNRRRLEMLVGLYETDSKRFGDRAVRAHAEILRHSPYRIDSYKALRKTYTSRKKPDEAWCLCAALTNLNMAEPDEQSFFEKHRATTPAHALEKLNEDAWTRFLMHPDASPLITSIFSTITPAVLGVRAKTWASYGVDRVKDKRDLAKDDHPVVRTVHYAVGVLGLNAPEVFVRPNDKEGLTLGHTQPPSLVIGGISLDGGDPQRMSFDVARALTALRPGTYLRQLVPTGTGLRAWLLASIKLAVPGFPVPPDLAQPIGESLEALKKSVTAADRDRLVSQVQKLVQSAAEIDLKRWVAAVDFTADRAGLLLANDLEVATSIIRKSEDDSTNAPQKDRLREAILFSVSESYFALRQKLGIALRAAG
ncbi:MAG: tetratricopeptide repeat protein [Deltaproteobacteria bacterium]|nr:tetratricopeptide repeat protein [Deltaproteobacteria bacterium]